MFQSFSQGKDAWDDDTTRIQPGRYRAHITSPRSSSSEEESQAGPGPSSLLARLRNGARSTDKPRRDRKHARRRQAAGEGNGDDAEELDESSRLLRPSKKKVEDWLDWWPRRWAILVLIPSLIIWIWVAVPFPVADPYDANPHWDWPPSWNRTVASAASSPPSTSPSDELPVDANFWFFLFWYFTLHVCFGLFFMTSLFSLYRLNWWPSKLGGKVTYFLTWLVTVSIGALLHHFDSFGIRSRKHGTHRHPAEGRGDQVADDWERKTLWVGLASLAMAMPAVACFVKLRRDRRMSYRHSMTETQKTFLDHMLGHRIPRSYIRFLWFCTCLFIALCSLIIGQGFASVYLSTLPHSSLDGVAYVWCWIGTVQTLNAVAGFVLDTKIRSRALSFVFRFYFSMIYFVFYRNLFARLRDPSQYVVLQILTSSWIVIWFPLSMSTPIWRLLVFLFAYSKNYEEHLEAVAQSLYLRNLAENVTMASFLGWLTILHYGPNRDVYPFFAFDRADDPYNYRLTVTASAVIWATELVSSFLARQLCKYGYGVDVTNTGLDELREYPELVPAVIATSLHVLSDMLLFLVRLNFR